MEKRSEKTNGGWLRRFTQKKEKQPAQQNERGQEEQQMDKARRQADTERAKAKAETERIAAAQLQIRERRAAREGDPAPIEILFEKGKHMHLSPDDRIRREDSAKAAAQMLLEMFRNKGDVLVTEPQQISKQEWTFDADFLNGVLHCTVTRQDGENVARYLLTDRTPEIWRELETTIPAVLGAVKISDATHCAFSVLCEVRDTDDPQKKILWIEDAFSHEKEKHRFAHQLIIFYRDPEQDAQTSSPLDQDGWEEYSDAVDRYRIFKNDRFPVFYTGGSSAFCGYMFMSWYALAVSANGALYMEADYDEPWETERMTSTELTDAFIGDILFSYEQQYKRRMKYTLSYAESEYMGGRYAAMTIEPDTQTEQ